MADQEFYGSPLGGHTDLLFSHPVYWTSGRAPNQPLSDTDPKYGKVYHVSTAADELEIYLKIQPDAHDKKEIQDLIAKLRKDPKRK